MPKDRVFYTLFEQVADTMAKMGKVLKEVVKEPDYDKRAGLILQIEDLEHVNDDFTHQIFTELGRNFITPFDREAHTLSRYCSSTMYAIISSPQLKKSTFIKLILMIRASKKWPT